MVQWLDNTQLQFGNKQSCIMGNWMRNQQFEDLLQSRSSVMLWFYDIQDVYNLILIIWLILPQPGKGLQNDSRCFGGAMILLFVLYRFSLNIKNNSKINGFQDFPEQFLTVSNGLVLAKESIGLISFSYNFCNLVSSTKIMNG